MTRYESAKEIYAKIEVDTDLAIEKLKNIPVSLHCWQGDDVKLMTKGNMRMITAMKL